MEQEHAGMPGQLGLLYEDMKDLRRRGEWKDASSDALGVAQRKVLAELGHILDAGSLQPASIARWVDVWALAERVLGDATQAEVWLHRPNASLAAQRPIDLLADDLGTAVVKEALERIDHGIFA